MGRSFAEISFTESVKVAQTKYGSRESNQRFEQGENVGNDLTIDEMDFIAERDSFYQATVSETGWPYVQHRGGPIGFLKVINSNTIGYADFRGNRQYLSVGNLSANDRVSIILMDYTNRRRLKIWGRVKIAHASESPELITPLEMPEYRARVERGMIISVEAFDWNCPQHITPRFTENEITEQVKPLHDEIALLKLKLKQYEEIK
jgi:hypothetical protein